MMQGEHRVSEHKEISFEAFENKLLWPNTNVQNSSSRQLHLSSHAYWLSIKHGDIVVLWIIWAMTMQFSKYLPFWLHVSMTTWPSIPLSGSHNCLTFGLWLTLCPKKTLLIYLLTHLHVCTQCLWCSHQGTTTATVHLAHLMNAEQHQLAADH